MAEIVNLRQARKQKNRTEAESLAAENRAKFGQTKAKKQKDAALKALDSKKLDGHKRDKPE